MNHDRHVKAGRSRPRRVNGQGEIADIVESRPLPGVEQVSAYFRGIGFGSHRHDKFAVGFATFGVQCFAYRGREHRAEAGRVWLLHPDESHDGYPLDARGFAFRVTYLDPALVHAALGGVATVARAGPLIDPGAVRRNDLSPLWRLDGALDPGELADAVSVIAELMGPHKRSPTHLPLRDLDRVRARIDTAAQRALALSELEALSGLDRWSLARAFRRAFGVSVTRYRTMRQLDLARSLIQGGQTLAVAANEAGFADQSHMTRKFASAFGVTPARWRAWHMRNCARTSVQYLRRSLR